MRNAIRLTFLILLFNLGAFGQREKYAATSNSEIEIFGNLILSFRDSSFVISPLVYESIDPSWIDIPRMVNKYGFIKSQFKNSTADTTLINSNKYFKVISADSIIKFSNLGLSFKTNDSSYIFAPYYYFIEKTYHKKCICEFSEAIFSKDKNYAITNYTIRCGMNDGYGETVLMKKVGLKWIVFDKLGFNGS